MVRGGKSGLHGNTVPGNARRGRPQGKCNRKQTSSFEGRVKRWGKSPPRSRQRLWQGKPHREQDRVGTPCRASARLASFQVRVFGWVAVRRPAMVAQEEWSSPSVRRSVQNPAYRPAGLFSILGCDCGAKLPLFCGFCGLNSTKCKPTLNVLDSYSVNRYP